MTARSNRTSCGDALMPTRPFEDEPANALSSRRMGPAIIVWFLTSGLSAGVLLSLQSATGVDPEALSLVMLAPAIGAVPAWLITRGHGFPGRRLHEGRRFAVHIGLALVIVCVYFAVISVVRGSWPAVPAAVGGVSLPIFVLLQAAGALGEEIGYRGILLHGLHRWLSRSVAAVITGVAFGFWHVQYYALPPLQFAAFVVGAVALTMTMASLMVGSFWQRMTVCTVLHLGANLALAFVGTDPVSMFTFSAAAILGELVAVVPILIRRTGARGTMARSTAHSWQS